MSNKNKHHVISASTILILSGFLIGLTVGKIVSESLSPYVLSCGLAGFLAFIALEYAGIRREEEEAHEERAQVQNRLDRHVMSLSSLGFVLPTEKGHHSDGEQRAMTSVTIDQKRLDALYERLMKIDEASDSQMFQHDSVDDPTAKVS